MILRAMEDYHQKTTIRFKQNDPLTERDYINIMGEDTGCWSSVGRQVGVSNTAQGVVKKTNHCEQQRYGFAETPPPSPRKHKSTRV